MTSSRRSNNSKLWSDAALAISLTMSLILIYGCGGPIPKNTYAPFAKSVLATRSYRIIEKAVSGKACDVLILGVSTGDFSYAAALRNLHDRVKSKYGENVKEYVLINQVDDWNIRFYLLVAKVCTVITADVAILGGLAPTTVITGSGSNYKQSKLPDFPKALDNINLQDVETEGVMEGLNNVVDETQDTVDRESELAKEIQNERSDYPEIREKKTGENKQDDERKNSNEYQKTNLDPRRNEKKDNKEWPDENKAKENQEGPLAKYRKLLKKAQRYRAIESFQLAAGMALQARKLWYEGAEAQKLLGTIYMQNEETKFAKKYYKEYLELKPNAPDAALIKRLFE